MRARSRRDGRCRRLRGAGTTLLGALVLAGFLLLGPSRSAEGAADRARPILVVGSPCSEDNFICPAFARALRTTGVRGRIFVRDFREDPTSSLTLLARQGHDVVFVDWWSYDALGPVARRFPKATFVLVDMPPKQADARLPNVVAAAIRTNEAASSQAGWPHGWSSDAPDRMWSVWSAA